ncbi:unnamed protein product [Cyprideis torosa]|uniref:Uncharacterized protein n=1 Tax=Cyprideis torosa TaxID=163714 RepID=A0A7R8ZNW2_9CRUS|nr:unnamed protein product [Cyprideis torosa]CAG0888545.1 unnamed protein product [Cyprideis torosa]
MPTSRKPKQKGKLYLGTLNPGDVELSSKHFAGEAPKRFFPTIAFLTENFTSYQHQLYNTCVFNHRLSTRLIDANSHPTSSTPILTQLHRRQFSRPLHRRQFLPNFTDANSHPTSSTPILTQLHRRQFSPNFTDANSHPTSSTPILTQLHRPPYFIDANSHPTSPTPIFTQLHRRRFSPNFIDANFHPTSSTPILNVLDCLDPTCNGRGVCIHGACLCGGGFGGPSCETPLETCGTGGVSPSSPGTAPASPCGLHGTWDPKEETCRCAAEWTGKSCQEKICSRDCGLNGRCRYVNGTEVCLCSPGWTGPRCESMACVEGCRGTCGPSGKCLCSRGWNGDLCSIDGCPNACNDRGKCVRGERDGTWACDCHPGWRGRGCQYQLETNCGNGIDDDGDGLVDCQDPECCSSSALCSSRQLCNSPSEPTDILLRKQPPALTASFFERLKFLIDEDGTQGYADPRNFNGSRAAVVRGRVVTARGEGIVGVRIDTGDPREGFTISRSSGLFDIMVNGGGVVKLKFARVPFQKQVFQTRVPWGQITVIDDVVMTTLNPTGTQDHEPVMQNATFCREHDYDLAPLVWSNRRRQGTDPEFRGIIPENQVVQESLPIAGTPYHLIYQSSYSRGYLSLLELCLTPPDRPPPSSLTSVHLVITIEGQRVEETLEPKRNLRYTYTWDMTNVYRQRVLGSAVASVRVGYIYENCTVWEVRTAELVGDKALVSEIGHWNLDIHHRYNPQEGILTSGDGRQISTTSKTLSPFLGLRGVKRGTVAGKEGKQQVLLVPKTVATDAEGNLYVGDFDEIKKIYPDGKIKVIYRFNASGVSYYRYHLTMSSEGQSLLISDPESNMVIRLNDTDSETSSTSAVVGNGVRCLPGTLCGDGGKAVDAQLSYPKGLAFSSSGELYLADGTNIRKVDQDGLIETIIGSNRQRTEWTPLPCDKMLLVAEIQLRWPTELALDPLDESLYFIDDNLVFKLIGNSHLQVIAGRRLHCPWEASEDTYNSRATETYLISPQSISFAPTGHLYIAESDFKRINRIRVRSPDGSIRIEGGKTSPCSCLVCDCYQEGVTRPTEVILSSISSIAFGPNGRLYIADPNNALVWSLAPLSLPPSEVFLGQQILRFDRFGRHIETLDVRTRKRLYRFSYTVNTSHGKLSRITDSAGRKTTILRDSRQQASGIECIRAKIRLSLDRSGYITQFIDSASNINATFSYTSRGLLTHRVEQGMVSTYTYDEAGRVASFVSYTGEKSTLEFDLENHGAKVTVTRFRHDGANVTTIYKLHEDRVKIKRGEQPSSTYTFAPTLALSRPGKRRLEVGLIPSYFLQDVDQSFPESFPVPGTLSEFLGEDLVHHLKWTTREKEDPGRRRRTEYHYASNEPAPVPILFVNGKEVLSVEYDRLNQLEVLRRNDGTILANTTIGNSSLITRWESGLGIATLSLSHDVFGRLISWEWGKSRRGSLEYDYLGRLTKTSGGLVLEYGPETEEKPEKLFWEEDLKSASTQWTYRLLRSKEGQLKGVIDPSGTVHSFSAHPVDGAYHLEYRRGPRAFRLHINEAGQYLWLSCGNYDQEHWVYDESDRLKEHLFGSGRITRTYSPGTGFLRQEHIRERNFEARFKYSQGSNGGLVQEMNAAFSFRGPGSPTEFSITYHYDGTARLRAAELTLSPNGETPKNSKVPQLPSYRAERETVDGTLRSESGLRFSYPFTNTSVVQHVEDKLTVYYMRNEFGQLTKKIFRIGDKDVFVLNIKHDGSTGKALQRRITMNGKDTTEDFTYNHLGYLTSWTDSGSDIHYSYDAEGVRRQGRRGSRSGEIIRDGCDRVVRLRDLRLEYNTRGQLLGVTGPNVASSFAYDAQGRLLAHRNKKGNVTLLVYLQQEDESPTWVVKEGVVILMLRDPWGQVIGWQEGSGSRSYVATDQVGSPIGFWDRHGKFWNSIQRDPWGKVLSHGASHFPLDFHGAYRDPDSELLFFGSRVYEPGLAVWLNPGSSSWTESVPKFLFTKPDVAFSWHQPWRNDPVSPTRELVDPEEMDLEAWLHLHSVSLRHLFSPSSSSHAPPSSQCQASHSFLSVLPLQSLSSSVAQFRSAQLFPSSFLSSAVPTAPLHPSLRVHLNTSAPSLPSQDLAQAETLAWAKERWSADLGIPTVTEWTSTAHRSQLLQMGSVPGYRARPIYSLSRFPFLKNDPGNIVFAPTSRRKKRGGGVKFKRKSRNRNP